MNNEDKGQIVLFQTEDGHTKLEVQLQDETVWLTIDQMAELFQRNRSTISRHIKRIYDDGELSKETTCAKFACVVNRGIRYLSGKGIRDLYYIKIARLGYRKEGQENEDKNDLRLVFEIERVGQFFDEYKKVKLEIWRTFTDTTMKKIQGLLDKKLKGKF